MPFSGPLFPSQLEAAFPCHCRTAPVSQGICVQGCHRMSWLGMTPTPFHSTINTRGRGDTPGDEGTPAPVALCTYQCNAPLPQVWAEVGICIPENYNCPPTGKVLAIQTPTYPDKSLSSETRGKWG